MFFNDSSSDENEISHYNYRDLDPMDPCFKGISLISEKTEKLKYFGKWKFKAILNSRKRNEFIRLSQTTDFDIEQRIDSLCNLKERIIQLIYFNRLKNQIWANRQMKCFLRIKHHRTLCKYFGMWESKLYPIIQNETFQLKRKTENSKNMRKVDILKSLQDSIHEQVNLQMKTDDLSAEIECAHSLIEELSARIQKKNDAIQTLLKHKIRYQEVKDTIQRNYEDTISKIKTQIIQIEEINQQKIQETQEQLDRLSMTNESINTTLDDSQDIIEKRKMSIQHRIEEAQKDALEYQERVKSVKAEQEKLAEENDKIQSQIEQFNYDCDILQRQTSLLEDDYENSFNSLKELHSKAQGIQAYYDEQIVVNYDTIHQNEETIAKLSKILDFYQTQARTNEDLFNPKLDFDDE